ncbi:CDP-glycerol glycerophosphotransferase family protein [Lacticaseibacillus mingshuiensis]|uniref:CDP-glycerol glycerophosphotransferase family protein n=1 Tax=Lacticaseibacillus mingshuiensis TaxID=2799574 RepID=UPI0019519BE5|nr:CDP-glycerol glycerophosphotransferase family protein [Lacticaseibacillus mingshuiensis]
MKTIAIIGFNLFAPGGTSRANMNMMHAFKKAGYAITFFNYRSFTRRDLHTFQQAHPSLAAITYKQFEALRKDNQFDYIFITRETFFPIAKYLRGIVPNANIIGEVNTALPLVDLEELREFVPYFSYIRLATESTQQKFDQYCGFDRTYVQTVSLYHLKLKEQEPFFTSHHDQDGFVNFLVRSRFEASKDIPYSLRLMDYLIHYLGRQEFRFFITGYGPSNRLLHNLVEYYHLEDNVFINEEEPTNYIYLSTSNLESFGYSIAESIDAGHTVAMYGGDDGVVKENFADFTDCVWLTKNVETDATVLAELADWPHDRADYQHDLEALKRIDHDYVKTFAAHVAEPVPTDAFPPADVPAMTFLDLRQTLELKVINDGLEKYRHVYYRLKQAPVIGWVVRQKWIKNTAQKFLRQYTHEHDDEIELAGNVTDQKLFVESFHGSNFSGDPKYLAIAYKKTHPDAEIFVSSRNSLVDMEARSYGFIPLRTGSRNYVYRFTQCKYVVINGNSLDKAGKLPDQVFIQTWHGFPMKKMVNDLEDEKQRKIESEAFAPRMQKWDYLTSSSAYNVDLLRSAFALDANDHLTILDNGTPKNEYLLTHGADEAERERLFRKYFNRPYDADKHFVLFCPTWRKGKRKEVSKVDLVQVVGELPANYEIIVKLHPNEGPLRKQYSDLDPRIHCFYNELVDIQELYILSDILISDYSSAIFDFALLNKKIIVLQEDEDQYAQTIGWYFDIKKECKLEGHAYTSTELADEILNDDGDRTYDHLIKERLLTNESMGSSQEIWRTVIEQSSQVERPVTDDQPD